MFKTRSYQKELLDQEEIPQQDLYRNLKELHTINTLLGGYKTIHAGMRYFTSSLRHSGAPREGENPESNKVGPSVLDSGFAESAPRNDGTWKGSRDAQPTQENLPNRSSEVHRSSTVHLLDIGSGGGDTLKFIFNKKYPGIGTFTGVDIKPDCIQYANKNCQGLPIQFIQSDYRKIINNPNFEEFDLITASLFCHHLTDDEIVEMILWMKKHARTGVIINDLHRHPFAYWSIKMLTFFFSNSYLVKHDAPLSVLRGFKRKDWERLMEKAGIRNYKIKWIWAFRWLVIIDNRP